MWDVVHSKVKYAIVVIVSALCFLLFFSGFEYSFFRSIVSAISLVTVLALVIGKYLWKYLYFDALNKYLCPDLNGNWSAKIKSNFGKGTDVLIPIKIEADFFSVRMFASTSFGQSEANYCRIFKSESNRFQLEYMFQVRNDSAGKGDAQFYEGAARLTLNNADNQLWKGVYWTNRCWNEGKNTAGEIELSRPEK
ncbi:hypothetical protein KUL17_36920 [Alteromonas sp. KUL17]|uniref:Cap15 family cyclic dinucleotide receptor domain-containing protein n=1 Tax=Alteromonas sp. KUL17 TaxID=2480796 RepID=UPI001037B548|nr:hypothetical protein [Alteromonas sp. KUL17]TAP20662.1 hypothetical protein KUL49_18420 [Alteromonas sp. KUL17]GEA04795.1 hypothetical protein KUL17_36920 [Alteromonas sp. KUL17]